MKHVVFDVSLESLIDSRKEVSNVKKITEDKQKRDLFLKKVTAMKL